MPPAAPSITLAIGLEALLPSAYGLKFSSSFALFRDRAHLYKRPAWAQAQLADGTNGDTTVGRARNMVAPARMHIGTGGLDYEA
ncbi:hypothetical protein BKA63DRAFT_506290 [Paraphoma chrysanthemicola]|nr:hypothetical protein BKA63DRAFT_506290 [Paraphoma chrysanthemicola]